MVFSPCRPPGWPAASSELQPATLSQWPHYSHTASPAPGQSGTRDTSNYHTCPPHNVCPFAHRLAFDLPNCLWLISTRLYWYIRRHGGYYLSNMTSAASNPCHVLCPLVCLNNIAPWQDYEIIKYCFMFYVILLYVVLYEYYCFIPCCDNIWQ